MLFVAALAAAWIAVIALGVSFIAGGTSSTSVEDRFGRYALVTAGVFALISAGLFANVYGYPLIPAAMAR